MHEWLPDAAFRTVYGMTETSSPATILPEDAWISPDAESNGIPIPGMKIRIADEEGREVPYGERGEIQMKGTNLLRSYYKIGTPFSTDGWFHTGDVGYFSRRGCLYVVDRIKDMINRGGEKIVSSDVEYDLLELEGIEEAAVVGIPHPVYGEAPAAVIRMRQGAEADAEAIRSELKERLAGYKIPVQYRFVESIPLTPNGKYDKKNMKKLFE